MVVQEVKELYKGRIEAAMEIWSLIMKNEVKSRSQLEELLYIAYKQKGIEPFRGFSKVRIYDKEIATVFIVGKYGLGIIDDDVVKAFKPLFNVEIACDEIYNYLKARNFLDGDPSNTDEFKALIENRPELGAGVQDRGFRLLRYVFTGVILRFFPEPDLVGTYRALAMAYKELEGVFKRYIRFYVAFKVAEDIALGNIRKVEDKKIMKYVYCLRLNMPGCVPSDALIKEIALRVYKVPKRVLDRLFPNSQGSSVVPKAE